MLSSAKLTRFTFESSELGNDLYDKGPDCDLQSHLTSTYLSLLNGLCLTANAVP